MKEPVGAWIDVAGYWLLLALILVFSVTIGAGSCWLIMGLMRYIVSPYGA